MNTNRISLPLVVISCAIVGFLIVYWMYALPELRLMVAAQQSLDQQTASVVKPSATPAIATSATQTTVDTLLPVGDQRYDLSVQVEAASHSAGVTLASMSLALPAAVAALGVPLSTTATASTPVSTLTATIAVTGSYANIQKFVASLVQLDRFITVSQATISAAASTSAATDTKPAANGDPSLSGSITAFAYYVPAPIATPAPTPKP